MSQESILGLLFNIFINDIFILWKEHIFVTLLMTIRYIQLRKILKNFEYSEEEV